MVMGSRSIHCNHVGKIKEHIQNNLLGLLNKNQSLITGNIFISFIENAKRREKYYR